MNDLDLCLEVVSKSFNQCVTFAIKYLGNTSVLNISDTVRDRGLVPKYHQ